MGKVSVGGPSQRERELMKELDDLREQVVQCITDGTVELRPEPVGVLAGRKWCLHNWRWERIPVFRPLPGMWTSFTVFFSGKGGYNIYFVSSEGMVGTFCLAFGGLLFINLEAEPLDDAHTLRFWIKGLKVILGITSSQPDDELWYRVDPV
ncbi:MAG: hypothetical protein JWO54_557 [Candidatus Saccharibacteria bacterium]|nr:hypothetical protein [Candidatus Saccharibacteria bacterium]MDB5180782.1 hypothetical protein [Candidatus Saccharibacteria bacterium]MDB5180797.1 hypothetical protein [Candidatus Saccharibacteria bacterium]